MSVLDTFSAPTTPSPSPPPAYLESEDDVRCPRYSCSIHLTSHVLVKHEYDTPFITSLHRNWQRATLDLFGTKLEVDAPDKHGLCLRLGLQAADVGLALDYYRRSNVVRIRAEGRQFLVALRSLESCLEWINALDSAIAISMPLDQRDEPIVATVPRRRAKLPAHAMGDDFCCKWREQWRRSGEQQVWLKGEPLYDAQNGEESHHHTAIGLLTHPHLISLTSLATGANQKTARGRRSSNAASESASDASSSLGLPSEDSRSSLEQHDDQPESELESSCTHKFMLGTASDHVGKHGASDAELRYATRCTRALAYNARWKSPWYYRNGRRFAVRAMMDEAIMRRPCVYI